jgi:hypothetical protein
MARNSLHNGGSAINKLNRRLLDQLSQGSSEGAIPAILGIDATLLEQLVYRRLAKRLPPLAPGASYRYRISEKGTRFLNSRE